MTTFNTPFGRWKLTRFPYGVHSAQDVFHKRITQSFDGMPQIETDIDDILIWDQKRWRQWSPFNQMFGETSENWCDSEY